MSYSTVPARLKAVRERIEIACERAGRQADEVTIIAVTKRHPADAITACLGAGISDIGENRVQELEEKANAFADAGINWHIIGHLQRNKAARAAALADMIHSVDSVRLARKLNDEVTTADTLDVLIQVNVAGEESKGGLSENGLLSEIGVISALPKLRVRGLMTMAPYTDDEGTLRSVFGTTRKLFEQAAGEVPGFHADHLSMGMSNDFGIAITEGSTMVRLGTVLFGERPQ